MSDETTMPFDFSNGGTPSIIKVIGVGGGGGNAVNHMYKEGIHDVTFVVCNTDNQALNESPVPIKLQLGREGLGAGNRPARARAAAEESMQDIENMLKDGCKWHLSLPEWAEVPVRALPHHRQNGKRHGHPDRRYRHNPFPFRRKQKIDQALDGVEEMSKHVDALLVINNERLRDVYSDLSVMNALPKPTTRFRLQPKA